MTMGRRAPIDVTGGGRRPFPGASAVLTELEAVQEPTGYARGRLRAVRMSALEPLDRNRAEALAAIWQLK